MTDFGLVIFETEEKDKRPEGLVPGLLFKTGVFKSSLCTRLFLLFGCKRIKADVRYAALSEDMNVWIIKLPFTIDRLSCFNSSGIKSFIRKYCLEKGITACFMPARAAAEASYAEYSTNHEAGQIIYKSYLEHILRDIYQSNGIRLGALDTVIVAGQDRQELFHIVRRLEPHFKYMTVAVPNNSDVDDELALISDESGLTINICSEWKSVLKNADLIINLAGAAALSKFRLNSRALVINYNNETGSRMQGENTVINGIEFSLSPEVSAILGTEVLRSFSKKELADVVIGLRIGRYSGQTQDDACCAGILEEFKKCGCNITGYTGRRGIIKAENIVRTVSGQNMAGLG